MLNPFSLESKANELFAAHKRLNEEIDKPQEALNVQMEQLADRLNQLSSLRHKIAVITQ